MNAIKLDIDKKLDGSQTTREHYLKLNNTRKFLNLPISPKNVNIKSLNLGNINSRPLSKHLSKENSSDKVILENMKKIQKNYINNLSNSNNKNNNIQKIKPLKKLELKEKDINSFNDFKIIKQSNKDLLFRKAILNNNIQSILFQNNNIKNIKSNNSILKQEIKRLNNLDNHHKICEINNIDINSVIDNKKISLIVKLDPKRSSSCLNNQKINEKIKNMKKNTKDLSPRLIDIEDSKKIKTPIKKLFIESDRTKTRESLSELINFYKNDIDLIGKNNTAIIINKHTQLVPEENHFKAVYYSQEIKKFNNALK